MTNMLGGLYRPVWHRQPAGPTDAILLCTKFSGRIIFIFNFEALLVVELWKLGFALKAIHQNVRIKTENHPELMEKGSKFEPEPRKWVGGVSFVAYRHCMRGPDISQTFLFNLRPLREFS